jgi:hypothetical protein
MASSLLQVFFCLGVMYSGEYDACDVTLSVYPQRESLKNMPDHGGNQAWPVWIYTLRATSQASYSPEYITPTQKKIMITRLH